MTEDVLVILKKRGRNQRNKSKKDFKMEITRELFENQVFDDKTQRLICDLKQTKNLVKRLEESDYMLVSVETGEALDNPSMRIFYNEEIYVGLINQVKVREDELIKNIADQVLKLN